MRSRRPRVVAAERNDITSYITIRTALKYRGRADSGLVRERYEGQRFINSGVKTGTVSGLHLLQSIPQMQRRQFAGSSGDIDASFLAFRFLCQRRLARFCRLVVFYGTHTRRVRKQHFALDEQMFRFSPSG
jgi:hypothetical protein